MTETPQIHALISSAQQAAAAGDYPSAEDLLRQIARLQEERLGPSHPDLAETLNNLAVACDIGNKPDEAERCFRRAYAIATAAFEPGHPFIATSRKNLGDFCAARGLAFEATPPSAPAPVVPDVRPAPHPPPDTSTAPVPARAPFGRLAVLGALAVAVVVLVVLFLWPSSRPAAPPVPETSSAETPGPAAAPPPAATVAEPETQAALLAEPPTPSPPPVADTAADASPDPDAGAAPPDGLDVADARLCADLSTATWECSEIQTPVSAGRVVFFTQVRSSADTVVEHRWYQNEQLHQAVGLRVSANAGSGYRTYSQTTVTSGSGDWRIEVTAPDGTILEEVRFTVR